jgi:hypothetical protein
MIHLVAPDFNPGKWMIINEKEFHRNGAYKKTIYEKDCKIIICPEPTALNMFIHILREWNEFHPYNMNRAYGSDMQIP